MSGVEDLFTLPNWVGDAGRVKKALAAQAGKQGASADPMSNLERVAHYTRAKGDKMSLTPAQERRMRKHARKSSGRSAGAARKGTSHGSA